jgi:undecaprenyl-phosphate 4-deoxy-4-formamido-L-arabinose transferase
MAGLNNVSGEVAIIMDDDFQNPISELLLLIKFSLKNSFDVSYTRYDKKNHSIFRNIGSYFNNKVSNIMLRKPDSLYLSSFKSISRKVINEIIKYDLPFPYLDGLILRTTRNLGIITVKHSKREYGKSGYTFRKLISLWLNMLTSFSTLPLRVSSILGLCMSSSGLFFAILVIVEKIINPGIPPGYSSTIIFILFFSGIQLMFLGIIGEYLGRLFIAQSKAPQYFITRSFD